MRSPGSWPRIAPGERSFLVWEEHEQQGARRIPAATPGPAAELWALVRSEQEGDRDYFSVCVRDEALGFTWTVDVDLIHSVLPVARVHHVAYDAAAGGAR